MKRWIFFLVTVMLGSLLWAQESATPRQTVVTAVTNGDVAALKKLLDANPEFGIDDVIDEWGSTLLMQAVYQVQPEVVELLLARGANPAIRDRKGFTVLDTVRSDRYSRFAKYKEDELRLMRLQKRSEDDVAKWLRFYEQQYSPEMQEKRLKIKGLIEKACLEKEKQSAPSLSPRAEESRAPKGGIENMMMSHDVTYKDGEYKIMGGIRNKKLSIIMIRALHDFPENNSSFFAFLFSSHSDNIIVRTPSLPLMMMEPGYGGVFYIRGKNIEYYRKKWDPEFLFAFFRKLKTDQSDKEFDILEFCKSVGADQTPVPCNRIFTTDRVLPDECKGRF